MSASAPRRRGAAPALAITAAPTTATSTGGLVALIDAFGLPEPSSAMSAGDEARLLLAAAAEVEHALMVQYLYAAYAIRPESPADPARHWQRALLEVAVEEMGHLITVQNLRLALGAPPYLERASRSTAAPPPGAHPFPFGLEPPSEAAVAKYVIAEGPPLASIADPALRDRLAAIVERAHAAAGGAINRVGLLFAKLFWLFQPDDAPHPRWPELADAVMPRGRHLADADFVTDTADGQLTRQDLQAVARVPPRLHVRTIPGREAALEALDVIAEQGEGWKLGDRSHFERLLELSERFASDAAARVLRVPVNPTTKSVSQADPALDAGRITHPAALAWARLLNVRYEVALLELALVLRTPASAGGPLTRARLLAGSVQTEMEEAMRKIAARLTTLPQRAPADGGVAAAPFEPPADPLPDTAGALRRRLRQTLDASRDALRVLEARGDPMDADDQQLIASLRAADAELAEALDSAQA